MTENAAAPNHFLDFEVSQGSDFSLSVTGATVRLSGGPIGGSCVVRVQDGVSVYVGACGPSAPSPTQPCQIADVRFYDDMGNPSLEGLILCRDLPNEASPLLLLDVTQSGLGGAFSPGRFRIANCEGLTLD